MAAIASHHVRLALFPLRLETDRSGYVDIPHSLGRRRLLLADVDTILAMNNAIFNDIFWTHLAYVTANDGIRRLRSLLGGRPDYAPVLAGFEAIDRGRRVLEDVAASAPARRWADDLIWLGNLQLLEHEQRALVHPHFDHLSCAFARLVSLGAATSFEVRGPRVELAYFTSFYLYHSPRYARRPSAASWPRSPATTTAGAGLRRASCHISASSMRTCVGSTPAWAASSMMHAATQPPGACYRRSRSRSAKAAEEQCPTGTGR